MADIDAGRSQYLPFTYLAWCYSNAAELMPATAVVVRLSKLELSNDSASAVSSATPSSRAWKAIGSKCGGIHLHQ